MNVLNDYTDPHFPILDDISTVVNQTYSASVY
jgi:hypothetical protein